MAELEILDVQFGHCARPEQVERGEEPAPPAAALIGYLPLVEFCREGEIDVLHQSSVEGDFEQVVIGDCILSHFCARVGRERFAKFLELFLGYRLAHFARLSVLVGTAGAASWSGAG